MPREVEAVVNHSWVSGVAVIDAELDLVVERAPCGAVHDEVVNVSGVSGFELDARHFVAAPQELDGVKPGQEMLVVVAAEP